MDQLLSALLVRNTERFIYSVEFLATDTLQTEADPNVVTLMARGNADNITSGRLTDDDKRSLHVMLTQMDIMGARIREALGDSC